MLHGELGLWPLSIDTCFHQPTLLPPFLSLEGNLITSTWIWNCGWIKGRTNVQQFLSQEGELAAASTDAPSPALKSGLSSEDQGRVCLLLCRSLRPAGPLTLMWHLTSTWFLWVRVWSEAVSSGKAMMVLASDLRSGYQGPARIWGSAPRTGRSPPGAPMLSTSFPVSSFGFYHRMSVMVVQSLKLWAVCFPAGFPLVDWREKRKQILETS